MPQYHTRQYFKHVIYVCFNNLFSDFMKKFVYQNKIISLYIEDAKIKNKLVKITKIYENDVVTILPILTNGNILIENQYRPVIKKWIYELPAGHLNKGETYITAAKRELKEETGYSTKNIRRMFETYPVPGMITQKTVYFVVKIIPERKGQFLDEDEVIKIKNFKLDTLLAMIKSGDITDNKTITALLYYKLMMRK